MKPTHIEVIAAGVERRVLSIRGQKVMLDADLAQIYGVPTKRLNEQVKRNRERFPEDFMFKLTREELEALIHWGPVDAKRNRSQFATGPQKHRDPRFLPHAFTEHGAIMAANVLNSRRAVQMSVFVVRAFVRLRGVLATNKELAHKLAELEGKVTGHDRHIQSLFEAIRQLMVDPSAKRRRIGFRPAPLRS